MLQLFKNSIIHNNEVQRVFFLEGQSNMDGRGTVGEQTAPLNQPIPRSKVYFNGAWLDLNLGNSSRTNQIGPILNLAYHLSLLYPTGVNYFIIHAVGGTSLYSDWASNKAQRNAATITFIQAMKTLRNPVCMATFWMQGESDCDTAPHADAYEANEINLIAYMKNLTGSNVFISGNIGSITGYPYLSTVQGAKANNQTNGFTTGLVDTSGFPLKADNLHFTTAGANSLGLEFYNIYESSLP